MMMLTMYTCCLCWRPAAAESHVVRLAPDEAHQTTQP